MPRILAESSAEFKRELARCAQPVHDGDAAGLDYGRGTAPLVHCKATMPPVLDLITYQTALDGR